MVLYYLFVVCMFFTSLAMFNRGIRGADVALVVSMMLATCAEWAM